MCLVGGYQPCTLRHVSQRRPSLGPGGRGGGRYREGVCALRDAGISTLPGMQRRVFAQQCTNTTGLSKHWKQENPNIQPLLSETKKSK